MTTKTVWIIYQNTDPVNGKGQDFPEAICDLEATARRIAEKAYPQGKDCPIKPVEMEKINGEFYLPYEYIPRVLEIPYDAVVQRRLDARNKALDKARKAGLSDEDILALTQP